MATCRGSGRSPARPQAPRAGRCWPGRLARGDDLAEGPRLLAAVLRAVRRRCCGWPPSGSPTSVGRQRAVRRGAPTSPGQPVRPRAGPGRRSGSTRGRTRRTRASRWSRPGTPWPGGGVAGTGIGLGQPRPASPYVETDFIFAAIGEELGLLGATAVLHRLPADRRRRAAHRGAGRTCPSSKLLATGPHRALGVQTLHHHRRGHPASCPSPASPCRSCPTAARRSSPTTCCWRCSLRISDDTARREQAAPSRRRGVGEPPDPPARRRPDGRASCVLFVQLNHIQVFHADDLNNNPSNTRDDPARLQPARGARSPPPTAWCIAQSVAVRRPLQVPARVPRGRPVRPRHRVTSASPSAARRGADLQRRAGRPHRSTSSLQNLSRPLRRQGPHRQRDPHPARRPAGGRPRRSSATAKGSVVALDPRTGAILALLELPDLRPQPPRRPRHGGRRQGARPCSTPPPSKPLLARTYQDRFFPGLDLQGGHRSTGGLQSGKVTADAAGLPRSPSLHATAAPPGRSRTSAASRAAARCSRSSRVSCNTAFAQMGVETSAPDVMIHGAEALRLQRRPSPSTSPAAARSIFPTDFTKNTAGPGPGVDRPERRRGHAAADGLVAGGHRQRDGDDHDAPRDRTTMRDSDGNVVDTLRAAACGRTPSSPRTAADHARRP